MSGQNFFKKKMVRDVPLDGQRVLLRADYNVPINNKNEIDDDFRITQSLPTLKYLLEDRKSSVVIVSHLGRPDGKRVKKYSLKPVAKRLSELLGRKVIFVNDTIGDKVKVATKKLKPGQVLLLENIRFYDEEEKNDERFAQRLAKDSRTRYFVQDGFGVVHRAHASTSAITQFLPSVGGLLLEREYQQILRVMKAPETPLVAVFGGAKVSDKVKVMNRFIKIADKIVVGGAMANTFLHYRGVDVGASKYEEGVEDVVGSIYEAVAKKVGLDKADDFIIVPSDVAVSETLAKKQPRKEVMVRKVHSKELILDIGAKSIARILKEIGDHGTVVWNGPLGLTEIKAFTESSIDLALYLTSKPNITSVVGGGDTADFVLHWNKTKAKKITHISTGGGASLELMSGKKLPGVEALLK